MKHVPWKISLILGILIFILPGCLDIWITTQIHPDGSIGQIIVFQGDSAEIAEVPFALMKEDDWKKEWTKPEKDKFKLVVSKEFKSVKQLNKTMNPADTNLQVVRINAVLHRKFRWFFTRFEYEETILNANPFAGLNYHKYLTDEEIRLISLSEDNRKTDPGFDTAHYKITEKKFEEYLFHCIYEEFYRELESVLSDHKELTLNKLELESKKDLMYSTLVDSATGDTPDDILKRLEPIIQHPDIQVIRSKYLRDFDPFKDKLKFYESASDDNYKFTIRMPGLLLQTNSPKIEGSETGWELTYYDMFFKDYTMTAESRMVNTWAFIVAGLILLLALAGLATAVRKKR